MQRNYFQPVQSTSILHLRLIYNINLNRRDTKLYFNITLARGEMKIFLRQLYLFTILMPWNILQRFTLTCRDKSLRFTKCSVILEDDSVRNSERREIVDPNVKSLHILFKVFLSLSFVIHGALLSSRFSRAKLS